MSRGPTASDECLHDWRAHGSYQSKGEGTVARLRCSNCGRTKREGRDERRGRFWDALLARYAKVGFPAALRAAREQAAVSRATAARWLRQDRPWETGTSAWPASVYDGGLADCVRAYLTYHKTKAVIPEWADLPTVAGQLVLSGEDARQFWCCLSRARGVAGILANAGMPSWSDRLTRSADVYRRHFPDSDWLRARQLLISVQDALFDRLRSPHDVSRDAWNEWVQGAASVCPPLCGDWFARWDEPSPYAFLVKPENAVLKVIDGISEADDNAMVIPETYEGVKPAYDGDWMLRLGTAPPGIDQEDLVAAAMSFSDEVVDLLHRSCTIEREMAIERWNRRGGMRYWLEWRDNDLAISVSLGDRILARHSETVKKKGRLMARLAFESSFDVWMEGWNPVWRPREVRIPLGNAALWTVHTVPQEGQQDEPATVCLTIDNASG